MNVNVNFMLISLIFFFIFGWLISQQKWFSISRYFLLCLFSFLLIGVSDNNVYFLVGRTICVYEAKYTHSLFNARNIFSVDPTTRSLVGNQPPECQTIEIRLHRQRSVILDVICITTAYNKKNAQLEVNTEASSLFCR